MNPSYPRARRGVRPVRALTLAGLLLGAGLGRAAETPPAKEPRGDIDIFSDSAVIDMQKREATYRGHVRATEPQMKLVCETMVAHWSETNRIVGLVAEGAVEIEVTNAQGTHRATGARAVYRAETDVVELTGEPKLITKQGTLTGERVSLHRASGKLEAHGNVHMVMPAEALRQPSPPGAKGAPPPRPNP